MSVLIPVTLTVMGTILLVGLVFGVWFTGGTFGQRCERAYPGDGLAQERCISNLIHDRAP